LTGSASKQYKKKGLTRFHGLPRQAAFLGVAGQRGGEGVLLDELEMLLRRILADAQQRGVRGGKFGGERGKVLVFRGAAGGVVFGIEEEHQGCTAELVAAARHSLGIRQSDQGGTIAGGEGGSHGEGAKLGSPP
jgi:hypothetical protein